LKEWFEKGKILVFVVRQDDADSLFRQLNTAGYPCRPLHGGIDQVDRDEIITDFKQHKLNLMIATSVASRVLDVKDLNLVVNYNVPSHLEDYIHRSGRTGRAGRKGTAVTFVTPDEENHAVFLVKAFEQSSSAVPADLKAMAENFQKKKDSGQYVKMLGSGFVGKGYKFDESDQKKLVEERKREKLALGIEDEGESDEQEEGGADEEEDEGVIRKKDAFKEPTASELQAAFLGNAVMLPSSDPLAHLDIAAQAVAQLASSGGGVIVARTGAASTDAAQKAKNMLLALVAQKQAGQKKEEEKNHFESEIEINDFPQNARWKVTHKDAMSRICDWTDCCITTKGTYVAPGKTVPPGEQKLYLLIEGPTHEAVKNARLEVKKILDEAVAMMPFQSPEGRTGKYSVV